MQVRCLTQNSQSTYNGYNSISHPLSFVNNISTCVYLPDLAFLCNTLKTHSTSLGCFINTSKTRILTSCNGTSPLAHITDANPSLGLSITQAIATFPNTPNPLNPTDHPLPVELTSGICLLGHPVGSASLPRTFSQHASPPLTGASPPSPIQSPTIKQDSASSPNASFRKYNTSCLMTSYTTYPMTTKIQPGKDGMARSLPPLTPSYAHSLSPSYSSQIYPTMQS